MTVDATWGLSVLAGVAIAAWGFWRIAVAPARGDWLLKLATLAVFACATLWTVDRLAGNVLRWDFAALMLSLAGYLWSGVLRHYLASRRRASRGEGWRWTSEPGE
jgi:multisubunit Na+/H+ antiporter MnhF subunit